MPDNVIGILVAKLASLQLFPNDIHDLDIKQYGDMQLVPSISERNCFRRKNLRNEPLNSDTGIHDEQAHRARSSRSNSALSPKGRFDAVSRSRISSTAAHSPLASGTMASVMICNASPSIVRPWEAARAPKIDNTWSSSPEMTIWLILIISRRDALSSSV